MDVQSVLIVLDKWRQDVLSGTYIATSCYGNQVRNTADWTVAMQVNVDISLPNLSHRFIKTNCCESPFLSPITREYFHWSIGKSQAPKGQVI